MAPLTTYGGNLIATLDFFRVGAKYYKVTEKIDVSGLTPTDVATLDFGAQLVLLKTVAHSLKILHDLHIVHSDLKPSNVLIKRTELGHTTKLIDFDSSYVVGRPPPPEEIVGTMNYYAPELVRYIQGTTGPESLTEAADIFALGLIYAEYLTGRIPSFDPAHHEPAIVVLHGETLKLSASRAHSSVVELVELVERMLLLDPTARPAVGDVHSTLMSVRGGTTTTTARAPVPIHPPVTIRPASPTPASRAPAEARPVSPTSRGPSALRGKGLRVVAAERPATEPPSTPVPPPAAGHSPAAAPAAARGRALLGKLLGKLEERRPR
jgi:serine/threonine protein kinase